MSLEQWLSLHHFSTEIVSLKGDASSRRYYRLKSGHKHLIAVDSSAQREALLHFVSITSLLQNGGLCVPKIYLYDLDLGYAVLEDLGSVHLFDFANDEGQMDRLRGEALNLLVQLQSVDTSSLPLYDEAFLTEEMALMLQWYLESYLKKHLSTAQKGRLEVIFKKIAKAVLSQPQGFFVHRDFHSKNLMLKRDKVCLIDFQDARSGAMTYDLVSLIKDLYVPLSRQKQIGYAKNFFEKIKPNISFEQFLYYFDITGLQRHIKVLGIFARLALRDGKTEYTEHLPQTLAYIDEVLDTYSEFDEIKVFLKDRR